MNEIQWHLARNDRSLRYPGGRVLNPQRTIAIKANPEYASRFDGQVAIITAANLLSRMTPAIIFDVPDVPIVSPLPWQGQGLASFIHETAFKADPHGHFERRHTRHNDYALSFGSENANFVVHGSGWSAFIGNIASPIVLSDHPNPIGPALASILAVSRLFELNLRPLTGNVLVCAFDWKNILAPSDLPFLAPDKLGNIWTIGTGSVGTAALYFLSLVSRQFKATLVDDDIVKVENLDRSPIFSNDDVTIAKVKATEKYLRSVGVQDITAEKCLLHDCSAWMDRQPGEVDVVIAAANEYNVRYMIEQGAPPIQIYGTTGRNWNAAVIRHTPLIDPCSCCLFPPKQTSAQMKCATAHVKDDNTGEQIDAALPFLSFAAGLMAAAEILKLKIPGYPFSPNRVVFNSANGPRFVHAPMRHRSSCVCSTRSPQVQKSMLVGSLHASLSDEIP